MILTGDVLEQLATLPDGSVHCVVTSTGEKASPCELAYCAGVVDSDGTIGIKRSKSYSGGRQPTYSERVCVKQVEPDAVDLLTRLFGGHRGIAKPSAKKGRPLHSWQVTDLRAFSCLTLLLPYLRIKNRQAENCINLRAVKERSKKARVAVGRGFQGGSARPEHLGREMERLRQRAHTLNAVGKEGSSG